MIVIMQPNSITAALETMKQIKCGKNLQRKIAILGDMVELGDYAKTAHKELCDLLIQAALTN